MEEERYLSTCGPQWGVVEGRNSNWTQGSKENLGNESKVMNIDQSTASTDHIGSVNINFLVEACFLVSCSLCAWLHAAFLIDAL